mgnify:CR=1 FL=1
MLVLHRCNAEQVQGRALHAIQTCELDTRRSWTYIACDFLCRAGREGWHQRMREKYGLDTSVFDAEPVPVASAPPEPKKNKCLIM